MRVKHISSSNSWVLLCLYLTHVFVCVAEMECTQWPMVRWPALPRRWFWRDKSVKAAKLPSPSRQLLHQPHPRLLSLPAPSPPPFFFAPSFCHLQHKDGDYDGVFYLLVFTSVCFIFAYSVFYYDQKSLNTCWTLFPILFLWFYTAHNENKSLKVTSSFVLISHLAIYI